MKKLFSLLLAAALCLGLAACGGPIKAAPATDEQKTAVIDAAKNCLQSEAFTTAVRLYEERTGETARTPKVVTALTHYCEDWEGCTVDAVFFRIEADVAVLDESGEVFGFTDCVLFAVDSTTGKVYDSLTYQKQLNELTGSINSVEDALLFCLNTPAVSEGKNTQLWSETETTTFFEKDDLKAINAALAG